jgi:hypothetical protein
VFNALIHMAAARSITCSIAIYLLPILSLGVRTLQPRQKGGARVATLIAMDIRLPREQKAREARVRALNDITSGSDVFMCTDRRFSRYIVNFSNVVHVSFLKYGGGFGVADSSHGGNTFQWYRLQKCWESVLEYERSNGLEYSFIVKLRTDCDSPLKHGQSFQCLKYHGLTELLLKTGNTAFLHSDYQFGAGRRVFSRIASLYGRIESDYWGLDAEYVNIDWGLVARCDTSAGKFQWLAYPKDAMGPPPRCFTSWCISRNKKLLEWSHTHSEEDANHTQVVTHWSKNFKIAGVSSEKILIVDLLRFGVVIQHFHVLHSREDRRAPQSFETVYCIDNSIDGDCPATVS